MYFYICFKGKTFLQLLIIGLFVGSMLEELGIGTQSFYKHIILFALAQITFVEFRLVYFKLEVYNL